MRDIVLRLTEKEAAILMVALENLVLPLLADEREEKRSAIKSVAESALKKLRTPLKRRKVI
ncbi:hypothetical protein [Pleomorphomonas carboxyditropha]|uniref:Uncharacterized protein n=1 Tax=Pleomorphomonas carboxyditropha TaxID=2023338 RepID=A0A2G9WV66_9HYPH|nr:hypothetical protein [Pleomorphomonas carboxyditropha]PIO98606.1 hypothetical protein CJ014_14915 [Pleomorphomonas carboxyditropha]